MRRLLFVVIILISCKPTEKTAIGTYTRSWDFEHHSRLTLERDKTFSFEVQEGLIFFELCGTWAIDKDKLVLNSPDNPSALSQSIITDKKKVNNSGVTLTVKDGDYDLPGAPICVFTQGQKQEYSTDISGQLHLKNEKWDSIQVSYIGFKPLTINAGPENMYNIRLVREEPIGIKFKNERWAIQRRRLNDPRFMDDKRKNTYKKSRK